ncbi:unnamed protein product [Ixodes hexagonus]
MLSTSPSNLPTIADCAPRTPHTQTTMEMEDLENMSGFFLDDYSAPGSPYNLMEEFSSIPAPSDDIWKKFELLPTPPRSPDRSDDKIFEDVLYDHEVVDFDEDLLLSDIIFEHEDIVDEILRDVELFKSRDSPVGWTSKTQTGELLHDCMWAGECAVNCTQKAAREKQQECTDGVIVLKPNSCLQCEPYECMGDAVGVATAPDNVLSRSSALEDCCVGADTTQCVDPSAVLAYTPLSDHCYHQPSLATNSTVINDVCLSSAAASAVTPPASSANASSKSASSQPIVLVRSRGVWKRDVCKREYVMSDTPSESDDEDDDDDDDEEEDDDDDDEEEDEEIDVVTVAGERQQHQNGHNHHRASTSRSGRAAHYHHSQQPRHQRHHNHHSQQQQYHHHQQQPTSPATPVSRTTSSGRVVTPSQKLLSNGSASRRKRHHHVTGSVKRRRVSRQAVAVVPVHQPSAKRSRRGEDFYASSCSSSDNPEDHERRKEHNSMERKRRDDLRSAFQHLRLMVPSLRDNPKAPKVMILNRAADHARELTSQSSSVEDALRKEMHRQRLLRKKLAQLQRSRKQR